MLLWTLKACIPELLLQYASLLLEATVELLRGDDCMGTFVYSRKASVPQAKQIGQKQQQPKGTEGDIRQRTSAAACSKGWETFRHPSTRQRRLLEVGSNQLHVLVKGKSFLGKPAPNKKQAKKNASALAIEWFFTNRDGATSKGAEPKQPATKKSPTKADRAKAALEMFTKSKEVAGGWLLSLQRVPSMHSEYLLTAAAHSFSAKSRLPSWRILSSLGAIEGSDASMKGVARAGIG
ncbi:unnamed protein product [Calypogeia fissa]